MSEHMDDFAPELLTAVPEFDATMTGPGRWAVLTDDDGALFGVLWTNDDRALGLLGTVNTSPPHQQAMMAEIRRAHAAGYSATEVWEALVEAYRPRTTGAGDLGELLNGM